MSRKGTIEEVKTRGLITEGDDVCIAMDAEMFRDMFNLMSALIMTEVQVRIEEDGLYVRQMDESHVALTDMFIPKTYFKTLRAGLRFKEIRLPVKDIKGILTRLGHGDIAEFTVTGKGKLHLDIKGRRLRSFNLPLFETEKLDRRQPRVPFNTRIKTSMEGVLLAIEDANKLISRTKKKKEAYLAAMVTLTTVPMGLHIESASDSGLYSAESTLTSGWDIMASEGKIDEKVMLSILYIADVISAVAKITNMIQIEFSTNMPVRLIAEMPFKGITLAYWFAPRVYKEQETEEAVPEKEVS